MQLNSRSPLETHVISPPSRHCNLFCSSATEWIDPIKAVHWWCHTIDHCFHPLSLISARPGSGLPFPSVCHLLHAHCSAWCRLSSSKSLFLLQTTLTSHLPAADPFVFIILALVSLKYGVWRSFMLPRPVFYLSNVRRVFCFLCFSFMLH